MSTTQASRVERPKQARHVWRPDPAYLIPECVPVPKDARRATQEASAAVEAAEEAMTIASRAAAEERAAVDSDKAAATVAALAGGEIPAPTVDAKTAAAREAERVAGPKQQVAQQAIEKAEEIAAESVADWLPKLRERRDKREETIRGHLEAIEAELVERERDSVCIAQGEALLACDGKLPATPVMSFRLPGPPSPRWRESLAREMAARREVPTPEELMAQLRERMSRDEAGR